LGVKDSTNRLKAELQTGAVPGFAPHLANTVSFLVEGADSISLLASLDLHGICASSGSACSAGSIEPSHVISALGYDRELANSLVRFSLGRDSSLEEVEFAENVLPEVVRQVQRTEKVGKSL